MTIEDSIDEKLRASFESDWHTDSSNDSYTAYRTADWVFVLRDVGTNSDYSFELYQNRIKGASDPYARSRFADKRDVLYTVEELCEEPTLDAAAQRFAAL